VKSPDGNDDDKAVTLRAALSAITAIDIEALV
jgi:hypothetical protein